MTKQNDLITKEDIILFDSQGLYDNNNRDLFEDCREYLELDDTSHYRHIFNKCIEYSLSNNRIDWLESFQDWIETVES